MTTAVAFSTRQHSVFWREFAAVDDADKMIHGRKIIRVPFASEPQWTVAPVARDSIALGEQLSESFSFHFSYEPSA